MNRPGTSKKPIKSAKKDENQNRAGVVTHQYAVRRPLLTNQNRAGVVTHHYAVRRPLLKRALFTDPLEICGYVAQNPRMVPKKMYCVVKITDDHERFCAAVPMNWVNGTILSCPIKLTVLNRCRENYTKPKPYWKKFTCFIFLRSIQTYEIALEKQKQYAKDEHMENIEEKLQREIVEIKHKSRKKNDHNKYKQRTGKSMTITSK